MTILGAPSSQAFRKSGQAMDTLSKNLANNQTPGRFADSISWQETSVAGKSSGVQTTTIIDINNQLSFTGTNNQGDVTIMGDGMLVVSVEDGSDSNLYVKTGSFNTNKNGDLEDNGKYLKGYTYDDNGNLSTTKLVQINIDKSAISEAEATTKIDLAFKLNANTVTTGESGVLLRDANTPGVAVLRDKSIVINKTIRPTIPSSSPSTEQYLLQFGGFVETNTLANITTTTGAAPILPATAAMTFTIRNGTQVQTRNLNVNIPVGTQFLTALNTIANEINNNHGQVLGAKVINNGNNSSLMIYSKDHSNQITITESANLRTAFNGVANLFTSGNTITAVDSSQKRFATVEQLQNILNRNSFNVSFIGAVNVRDKIFLYSTEDEMLEIKNQDVTADILNLLGLSTTNQGILEPVYSYLDPKHNIAGGHIKADYQERVSILDSKGGKKDITFAFKKISTTSWVAEVYAKDGIDATSNLYRDDGLIQAGILNFNPEGQYINSTPVTANIISNNYFADPSTNLGGTTGNIVNIGGQAFTYNAAPAAPGEFNSLVGLIDTINSNNACNCTAALAHSKSGFALILKPKVVGNTINIGGQAALLNIIGLVDSTIPTIQNTNIPLFGTDLTIDWAATTTQVAPTNAQIKIEGKTSKELKGQKNLLTYKTDGSPLGEYDSWYISKGDLYMKFKNGAKDRKLYAIPVAVFQAAQFLKRENGAYAETGNSGTPAIRLSGEYAGIVESKALAESGSNSTDQLVDIVGMQQFGQMNATAMSIANKLMDEFLRKI